MKLFAYAQARDAKDLSSGPPVAGWTSMNRGAAGVEAWKAAAIRDFLASSENPVPWRMAIFAAPATSGTNRDSEEASLAVAKSVQVNSMAARMARLGQQQRLQSAGLRCVGQVFVRRGFRFNQ